jgi:serine/threonine-protein kinase
MSEHSDDAATQDLLDAYLRELQAGGSPDRAAILSQRPDLASALDCLEMLERLAPTPLEPPGDGDPSHAPTMLGRRVAAAGERVGKYAIERELGRGGMGVVYLARDTELDRPVALKMILSGNMAGAEYLRRFQAEVRASAQLDHEGIVRVYDSGEFNGLPFLAMQYVEGPSLADYLRQHRPDADWAVHCVLRLARTVAYLHSKGIVHRDLKPANILLVSGGVVSGESYQRTTTHDSPLTTHQPKITDFGLAKLLAEETGATRSGVIVGTPSYMAPEQARGESRSVGPAADIYALGAILYELLTGHPPFTGDTALSTLMQVMGNEPLSPRRIKPELHRDLEAICLKCLEKSPERRFASAAELAEALERHLKGEDVPSARLTPGQAISRWVRRNPALASRIAILVICVGILYTKSALRIGSDEYGRLLAKLRLSHLTLIFGGWLGLSWLFQRLLRYARGLAVIPYVWTVADVSILTATLVLTDSLVSPIDIGYPLLIAAAGLWLRPALVWFTLTCTLVAYGGGTLLIWSRGDDEQLHRHVIFLAGLVTMAFLVNHQVQRFRALSRFYEGRAA